MLATPYSSVFRRFSALKIHTIVIMYIFEITISSEKSFEFICKEGEMAESDEELFITQNTFITEEITESDVI